MHRVCFNTAHVRLNISSPGCPWLASLPLFHMCPSNGSSSKRAGDLPEEMTNHFQCLFAVTVRTYSCTVLVRLYYILLTICDNFFSLSGNLFLRQTSGIRSSEKIKVSFSCFFFSWHKIWIHQNSSKLLTNIITVLLPCAAATTLLGFLIIRIDSYVKRRNQWYKIVRTKKKTNPNSSEYAQ